MPDTEGNHIKNSSFNELPDDSQEEQAIDDYQVREKKLKIIMYRFLGLFIIFLGFTIIVLVTITFFYHPGQPNTTTLLIDQIFGFVLAMIGLIVGFTMFFHSKKLAKEKHLINIEQINEDEIEELAES